MSNQLEQRSEFSRVMRLAQQAKREKDWSTVRNLQVTLTHIINKINQGV